MHALPSATSLSSASGRGAQGARLLLGLEIAALLAVSVWFRFWKLDHLPGVNGDEAWYGVQALHLLQGQGISGQTPTGNPINLLFLLPHVCLHATYEPSFGLLRLPAVFSGLIALLVNFLLCRRMFDVRTALVSTVVLAVLPINIVYSRFSWDPAQTLLATVVVMYLAAGALQTALACQRESAVDSVFRRQFLVTAIAWAVAIAVHPTNLFLGPLVAAPALVYWRDELRSAAQVRRLSPRVWLGVAAAAVLLLAVAFGARHWLIRVVERFTRPGDVLEFCALYVQLFWGTSSFQFLAGSGTGQGWAGGPLQIAGTILAVTLMFMTLRYLLVQRPLVEAILAIAYLAALLAFFLVGGPPAIAPHYERYAIWVVAPASLLVARALIWWADGLGRALWQTAVVIAGLWLTVFAQNYFSFVEQTGGQSHRTFRTARVEPKLAAWQQALRWQHPGDETLIGTSDYWTEQPLAYLAAARPSTSVVRWNPHQPWPGYLEHALNDGRICFIEYWGEPGLTELRKRLAQRGLSWDETRVVDFANRPLLVVVRPVPISSAPPARHVAAIGSRGAEDASVETRRLSPSSSNE